MRGQQFQAISRSVSADDYKPTTIHKKGGCKADFVTVTEFGLIFTPTRWPSLTLHREPRNTSFSAE